MEKIRFKAERMIIFNVEDGMIGQRCKIIPEEVESLRRIKLPSHTSDKYLHEFLHFS